LSEREQLLPIFENAQCLSCPNFLKHFEMQHAEYLVKTQIQNIMHQMSDQNLALLPDYNQRVEVLKDLGFIDAESRVLLKGKVACEIHSADELILTELILENTLADFEPSEIVALLSSFVFQEKSDVDPYTHVNSSLQRGIDAILAISKRVNDIQILHQVVLSSDEADFENQPRFQLVEVVYQWAEGMGFKEIMDLTDVMEGTIVRVVTRLDETCREVMSAARLIGDPGLYAKMEKAREMIRRDVVFTASLYM
jgi:antiviral helicase SKI2